MKAKTIAAYSAVLAAIAGIFGALETWLAKEICGTLALLHWIKAIAPE